MPQYRVSACMQAHFSVTAPNEEEAEETAKAMIEAGEVDVEFDYVDVNEE